MAEHEQHHVVARSIYYAIFGILMVLTLATVAIAYVDLGPMNAVAALVIACIKATIVVPTSCMEIQHAPIKRPSLRDFTDGIHHDAHAERLPDARLGDVRTSSPQASALTIEGKLVGIFTNVRMGVGWILGSRYVESGRGSWVRDRGGTSGDTLSQTVGALRTNRASLSRKRTRELILSGSNGKRGGLTL